MDIEAETLVVAPGVEGVAAPAEPKAPETPKPAEAAPEAKAPKIPPAEYRAQKLKERVDRLTREKSALEAEVANRQTTSAPKPLDDAALAARIDAAANEKAIALTAQRAFDAKCLEVFNEGKASFPDFADKIKDLQEVAGGPEVISSDPREAGKYTGFIDAIIETGEGARLIYELAKDPEEAERIYRLPPVKQGIALAKLALVAPVEPASAAPKPITPIGSRSASHVKIDPRDGTRADSLSTAEWMARRNEQALEAMKARRGY